MENQTDHDFFEIDNRLPIPHLHSVIARIVLDSGEIKFFVSKASPNKSVENLRMIGFCIGVLADIIFQTNYQMLS